VSDERYPREELDLAALRPGQVFARDLSLIYYRRGEDGRDQQLHAFLVEAGGPLTAEAFQRVRELAQGSSAPAHVFAVAQVGVSSRQIILFVALLLTAGGLYVLVQRTRFGRAMRAVSVDLDAARLMGVNVDRVIAGTFFVGAFVAGVGGVLAGGMYYERIDPLMGLLPGLKAFVAAVLGGIGSIPGAILGALLLGISEKMVEAYLSSGLRDALAFAILIGVLLIRPQGLLGSSEGEKI
jgi:branched-chain amino acid transport system permease protein